MSGKRLSLLAAHLVHNILALALFGLAVRANADVLTAAALVLLAVVLDAVIAASALGDT